MSKEFFSEIFRLFAEYEHDLTIYCHDDMAHNWECEMSDKKKLSDSDKQLLKHIVKTLGANYNSKLAKLYHAFEIFVETGEGTIKIKMPDGVIEMVPIKTLVGGGFFDKVLGKSKKRSTSRSPEKQRKHDDRKAERKKSKSKQLLHNVRKFAKHTARNVGTAIEMAQQASDALEQSTGPELDANGQPIQRQKRTSPFVSLAGITDIIPQLQKLIKEIHAITTGTFDAQQVLDKPVVQTLVRGINAPTLEEFARVNEKLDTILSILRTSRPHRPPPPPPKDEARRRESDIETIAEPVVIA